jgi:hypothetical protein
MASPNHRLLVSLVAFALLTGCGGGSEKKDAAALAPSDVGPIAAPAQVGSDLVGFKASVPSQPNASFSWSVSNGTILSGGNTPAAVVQPGSTGQMTLTCTASTAGGSVKGTKTINVVPTPTPVVEATYGNGIASEALTNLRLGTDVNYEASVRFRALYSGPLASFRNFWVFGTGYAAGTGGKIQIQLRTDDGTSNHGPGSTVLASLIYDSVTVNDTGLGGIYFKLLTFPAPLPNLTAGQLYHLVYTNVDPDPVHNYVSLNGLLDRSGLSPQQPRFDDLSWSYMTRYTSRPNWVVAGSTDTPRSTTTPILELIYADGSSQGCGYMEVWVVNPKPISTTAKVSEIFTVSNNDRKVNQVSVRVTRDTPTAVLQIQLIEDATSNVLASGTVDGSLISDDAGKPAKNGTWVSMSFPQVTLTTGTRYRLVLSATSGSFETFPIRDGQSYFYGAPTCFRDGWAEYDAGDGTGWHQWVHGGTASKEADLKFWFNVVP